MFYYGAPSVQLLHTQNIHIHTTQLGIDNVDTHIHTCLSKHKFIWALKERVQVFTAGNVLYKYPCMVYYPRVVSTPMNIDNYILYKY